MQHTQLVWWPCSTRRGVVIVQQRLQHGSCTGSEVSSVALQHKQRYGSRAAHALAGWPQTSTHTGMVYM